MKIEILEHPDDGPTFAWSVFGALLGLFSRKALALAAAAASDTPLGTIQRMEGATPGIHAFRYNFELFRNGRKVDDKSLFATFGNKGVLVEPIEDEKVFRSRAGLPADDSDRASYR